MWIYSSEELGLVIRENRKKARITQAELARRVGATRQWVIALEKGNPGSEFDRVMKALLALGLRVNVIEPVRADAATRDAAQDLLHRTAGRMVRRLSTARRDDAPDSEDGG